MILRANCKINLGLDILRRRADGYHDLETVMLPVRGLYDEVEVVRMAGAGGDFRAEGLAVDCEPEQNICIKAFRLMHDRYGVDGVSIRLDKRVPFGAGLGGGSSDGTAVLLALDRLFNLHLSEAELIARAAELGMENTVFCNCTGLPAKGHHSTAHDIALMSRELIRKHPDIRTYTTIWMDTLRDGSFQLANTNKLIRFYDGATGLKTGSTDGALYCISATAEKDGMELIAVVLGSPTSADRFEAAKALLNYGFAGYSLVTAAPSEPLSPIPVTLGVAESVQPVLSEPAQLLLPKADAAKLTTTVSLPDTLQAPVEAGQQLGTLTVLVNNEPFQTLPLTAQEPVPRLTLWQVFQGMVGMLCGK